ncbi:MAG: 4Fe-4S ferredoxin [Ignavibacteriaceae bacterium]|nr:4Fe-4S ferredoxin [Ignavibacteriaceae bacterium]
MLRKIIQIEEEKCDGCGECVPNCAEGALQIIDGKVRLISDLFCDGLGACIGHCPQNAITVIEREAEPYDEKQVMEYIVKGGSNVIKAHLHHLKEHREFDLLTQALDYLNDNGIENPLLKELDDIKKPEACGCPGSREMSFNEHEDENVLEENGKKISHLRQWPVQLHLVSPNAGFFKNADLLLAADCVPIAYPDFHKDFLQGKSIAIACPKLDSNKQVYLQKLVQMISDAKINSITVVIMQVPCCSGLIQLAMQAVEQAERIIPVKVVVVGIHGEILQEEVV